MIKQPSTRSRHRIKHCSVGANIYICKRQLVPDLCYVIYLLWKVEHCYKQYICCSFYTRNVQDIGILHWQLLGICNDHHQHPQVIPLAIDIHKYFKSWRIQKTDNLWQDKYTDQILLQSYSMLRQTFFNNIFPFVMSKTFQYTSLVTKTIHTE